ncbi:D-alanyl-D-alanine carboxypeptidase family protein [Candidatus Spongiihabitans sp.]|uniref:D-alanyl-D-alanine carboxypeptidase family protein n=1 Tax=Candidatus Spongiihabitans sp. TaxID=3101308 RepID=UPI003C7ABAF5
MRLLIYFISFLLFHPLSAHSALQDIPDAVKSKIAPPSIDASSWLVADFETGWVLAGKNTDQRIEPASLTKLMTSYLVFEALRNNEITMQDRVYISEKAWRTGGSKMFIEVGARVSVLDLIQGLIVQSGNDAGVALAEHIDGSEQGFASRMNLMAAELGMTNTNFTNSSGIPEDNHYSTVEDMTLLSMALIRKFPELYRYYSQSEFTYNDITQQNRNILLTRDPTVDGIKTGYTKNAGYGFIGTALRDGMRLVAAVTGSSGKVARADQVQSLLQYGYGAYEGLIAYQAGTEIKSLPLWFGETSQASIGVLKKLSVIFPKGKSDKLSATLELPASLEAPIAAGAPVGYIQVKYDQQPIYRTSLQVNESYAEGPWHKRILDYIKQLIF